MKQAFILVVGLLFSCLSAQDDCRKLALGQVMEIQKTEAALIISSSEILPSSEAVCNDVRFQYAIRWLDSTDHSKGRVVYFSTTDPRFAVPEGPRSGDTLNMTALPDSSIFRKEKGWGSFVELASGWNLGLQMEGPRPTDLPIGKEVVRWVFQRRRI